MKIKTWVLASAIAAASHASYSNTLSEHLSTLQQAQTHLNNHQGQAAWELLHPLENTLAGDADYDLLLGQAALSVKQNTRALLAFERCIVVFPAKGECHLGLAQAHMQLRELASAKEKLEYIKRTQPPEAVAQTVDYYLGLLANHKAEPNRLQAWLEMNLGYDNNTNVAPSSRAIALPGALGSLVGEYRTSQDESFYGQASFGLSYQMPINQRWQALMGGSYSYTNNFDINSDSIFNENSQTSGYLGINGQLTQRQGVGLMVQGQNYRLGDESYRNAISLMGQYSYYLSNSAQISGFVQRSRFNYMAAGSSNMNNTTAGLSAVRALKQNQVVLFAGGYVGQERKTESSADKNINSDFFGLRGGVTWLFKPTWKLGLNLSGEQREYQGDYKLSFIDYEKGRSDTLISSELALIKQFTPKLRGHVKYNHHLNNSNIPVTDYRRQIIDLGVRYDFF